MRDIKLAVEAMPITDNLCSGIEEKEYRATQSKERHKICKRNYINKKRQADKQEYQAMIIQINKDNEYLSTKKNYLMKHFQIGIEECLIMISIVVI